MSTIQRCLVIPAALFAMIALSSSVDAQCDSCNTGCGGFGFPSSCAEGCGSCGAGSVFSKIHQGIETYKADARLNRARGEAWPKPFSCWDREHYFAIINQQYATGLQTAHTLTSEYFESETNVLNQAGEMRVAWIMQNAPRAEKQIFVYEDETGPTMDQRMTSIRNFTNRYYAHLGNATIAKSQILPHQIPASFQQGYLQRYADGQPDPIIPVTVGQSLQSSVGR